MRPLKILTWHVHGSYLYYLAHLPHEIWLPVDEARSEGYVGRTRSYPWPANVKEIPVERVRDAELDVVLFQAERNWARDQHEILSPAQRRLPRIFLEHDPPRAHPTDTRHPVQDEGVLLVHVTPFNALMWDAGVTPATVIEHGVAVPEAARYTGELERGLVVVNNIRRRGRRLGHDLWEAARTELPLDLVGMGWEEAGGLGEIAHAELPWLARRYRFFFNPIRYTSLGLAILEAMAVGLPIVGLKTTELATVIEDGVSGFLSLDPKTLHARMRELLRDPDLARRLGEGARRVARDRFDIRRFTDDWDRVLRQVAGRTGLVPAAPAAFPGRTS